MPPGKTPIPQRGPAQARGAAAATIRLVALAIGCATALGCSSGGTTPGDEFRFERDGGSLPECDSGEHICGSECVADEENTPDVGCRRGCGSPCTPPEDGRGEATCSPDGFCDVSCTAPYAKVGGQCECDEGITCESAGAQCGDIDDGCGGTITCGECGGEGESCSQNQCTSCTTDDGEPNEDSSKAFSVGEYKDGSKTSMEFTTYGLHGAGDVDWFVGSVKDTFGVTNPGNPDVKIVLRDIPTGDDYTLAAWFECDKGNSAPSCAGDVDDPSLGSGCISDNGGTNNETIEFKSSCDGTSDDGTLYVRVTAKTWSGTCSPYTLAITVD
ncbi:MAG: hypothetical protein KC416_07955 [Myxococcales bacterium]|nr:hypothetical protein [Myxococcales bacterium]